MAKTRLSSKGQVIIPKAVRERHGWRPGLELEVEDQGEVVVLRPARSGRPESVVAKRRSTERGGVRRLRSS